MDVLDKNVVRSLKELGESAEDPGLLDRLVGLYCRLAPESLRHLQAAVNGGADHGAVLTEAHSLKSSSANLGLLRVSELCREMEEMARIQVPIAEITPLLRRLEKELPSALAKLEEFLTSSPKT